MMIMTGEEFERSNRLTLAAYQADWQAYVANTPTVIPGIVERLKLALDGLKSPVRIFEFGSGSGRDALWLRSQGYEVDCSDATPAFVDLMRQQGLPARQLNVLTDDLPTGYDLILATGVMHHFQPAEAQKVIAKVAAALRPAGRFAFSLKRGRGQTWYLDKLSRQRYCCYWRPGEIDHWLKASGFDRILTLKDTSAKGIDWLSIVAAKVPGDRAKENSKD